MEWIGWEGKKVFIKLKDGSCFSKSYIIDSDEFFLRIRDRDNIPSTIAISEIIKIVEDEDDMD